MSSVELEQADAAYEAAERAALDALRTGAGSTEVARAFGQVATAAEHWNSVAYSELHKASGDRRGQLDALTERTESVSELWRDIADAATEGTRR
jgi:hypothetical protein